MIWHPGALALLVGSGSVLLLAAAAVPVAVRVLLYWDIESAGETQFELEKSTSLISALLGWALTFNAASFFLFIAVADDFSGFLRGAMCATGTLNANSIGWAALGVKFVLLLAGGLWAAINSLDNHCPDYPLIRLKYRLLLCLVPLFAVDFILLWMFFAGIEPDVITSCCGSLFSGAPGAASSIAGYFPPKSMMAAHHFATASVWCAGLYALASRRRGAYAAYSLASALYLPLALAGFISFIAPYIYGLPFHHCPFDTFGRTYGYIGYPIFISLLAATLWGIMPGLFAYLGKSTSLGGQIASASVGWVGKSLAARAIMDILVYYKLFFTGITLY